jgi:glycosyltransferase involved in cell wall biosynthesis
MRICYLLLSPTFGMHQYTADLANRMVRLGHEVSLVTSQGYPADRYLPDVSVYPVVQTRSTGASLETLRLWEARNVVRRVVRLEPDVVHITGPHAWNTLVLSGLRRAGIRTVHTVHDVEPHAGGLYGRLVRLWNGLVLREAEHIVVHAEGYRRDLLARGVSTERVTAVPLTHLFLSAAWEAHLPTLSEAVVYEPMVLFFGRLEPYKGIDVLLEAWQLLPSDLRAETKLVLAGAGDLTSIWPQALPEGVELRNRRIGDDEAVDLFRTCAVLALPYTRATQSALVAAAYCFRKPVIATHSGALPEYVVDGQTGWLVDAGDAPGLSSAIELVLASMDNLRTAGAHARRTYDDWREAELSQLLRIYSRWEISSV